jgi:hypothetical protein
MNIQFIKGDYPEDSRYGNDGNYFTEQRLFYSAIKNVWTYMDYICGGNIKPGTLGSGSITNKQRRITIMKISKRIQDLANKYNLDVKVKIVDDGAGVGNMKKLYKFSGNFLANFDAMAREAKQYGYVKSTAYDISLLYDQCAYDNYKKENN